MKNTARVFLSVIVIGLGVGTVPAGRNAVEEVADALPEDAKVLLILTGAYQKHWLCEHLIEEDHGTAQQEFLSRVKKQLRDRRNKDKNVMFEYWHGYEQDLTREEKVYHVRYAEEVGVSHILYVRYEKVPDLTIQPDPWTGELTGSISWRLELKDAASNSSESFSGSITSQFGREVVVCPRHAW